MIPGLARGSVGPFSAANGALEVLYGGTGGRSPADAAKNLGVPSLDANNAFTGTNQFGGPLQSYGGFDLTLPTGFFNIIDDGGQIQVLDFSSLTNGWTWAMPNGSGTLAMTGDPLNMPYNAKSALYTASSTDCVINCNGTFTVTLPTAVGVSGQMYFIKNSGVGVVTVACTGGQTIDGAATVVLAAAACLQACSDGANWIVL